MKTYPIQPGEACYVYQAAFLCAACGETLKHRLDADGKQPEDPDDETTFDSDDYPKGPYRAEYKETCDSMDRCLSLVGLREPSDLEEAFISHGQKIRYLDADGNPATAEYKQDRAGFHYLDLRRTVGKPKRQQPIVSESTARTFFINLPGVEPA